MVVSLNSRLESNKEEEEDTRFAEDADNAPVVNIYLLITFSIY